MDPQSILFSTPTLNDALPAAGAAPAGDDCPRVHEDDWRQFEFVAAAHYDTMLRELAAIDAVWRDSSVPLGEYTAFREVHIRSSLPVPVGVPYAVRDFESLLGARATSLSFWDLPSALENVHAVSLNNLLVYAEFDGSGEQLVALGLHPLDRFSLPQDVCDRLETFLTDRRLLLVHWRSRTLFDSPAAAMSYLRGKPA